MVVLMSAFDLCSYRVKPMGLVLQPWILFIDVHYFSISRFPILITSINPNPNFLHRPRRYDFLINLCCFCNFGRFTNYHSTNESPILPSERGIGYSRIKFSSISRCIMPRNLVQHFLELNSHSLLLPSMQFILLDCSNFLHILPVTICGI